ncbi:MULTISPECIES: ATP-binding protein [Streptomyces]|uniref:ATP-binding protein n=2 Tax=Streptomyces TaxID=1883 RepID=A0ABV9IZA4_9ACTN
MNSEISTQISTPLGDMTLRFSSTPRGARLARRLAAQQLTAWGHPYGGDGNHTVQQVVAELAANAVTHGRVPGRDFELRLLLLTEDTVRVEVSDTRGDRSLRIVRDADAEGGRGLIVVTVLSRAWGVTEREVGKTVWAEVRLS